MKKGIIFSGIILLISCSSTRITTKQNSDLDLIKQLAYCECMEHSINQFVAKGSNDMSMQEVANMMEYNGMYTKNVAKIMDSLALEVVTQEKKNQFDTVGKHNDDPVNNGRTIYLYDCLKFYKSQKLDSIVRAIPKSKYYINF